MGTTVTALLGAMSANVAGKRLALAHLFLNLTTGAIAIIFILPLAQAVDAISGGVGIAPDNFVLKFAVFHTLFNVIGVAVMTPLITVLVGVLGRLVPEKALHISMPRYLNDAALAFPDTALKAIFEEVGHLYKNAFGFMALGLGLAESDLRSNKALPEVIRAARPLGDVDLDGFYQRWIKGLHTAIVDFATKAEPNMVPDQVGHLQSIRSVARDLVLAVKDVKHLHKNMRRYANSPNADISAQYDAARLLIATVLRATQQIKDVEHIEEASLQALEQLKADIDQYDIVENGTLDGLIREGRITPVMATSLINDSGYTQNISRRLIDAGLLVLRTRTYDLLRAAERGHPTADAGAEEAAEEISGVEARAASAY